MRLLLLRSFFLGRASSAPVKGQINSKGHVESDGREDFIENLGNPVELDEEFGCGVVGLSEQVPHLGRGRGAHAMGMCQR